MINKKLTGSTKRIVVIACIAILAIAGLITGLKLNIGKNTRKDATGNSADSASIQKNKNEEDENGNSDTSDYVEVTEIVTDAQGNTQVVAVTDSQGVPVTVRQTKAGSGSSTTAGVGAVASNATAGKSQGGTTGKTADKSTATKETTEVAATAAKTKSQINTERIDAIYNTYGVQVQTGEAARTWHNGEEQVGITDVDMISDWLDIIEEQLARYPAGFFRDMADVTTFKIKLFSDLGYQEQGYASYELGYDMFVAIDADCKDGFPTRVLNHEIMHIIDHYIYLKSWNAAADAYVSPLAATENYVPAGFSWGDYSDRYIPYSGDTVYFVTRYAKTNPNEDRAETFADYMFRTYQYPYMRNPSDPIPSKMQIIADTIRDYFPSARRVGAGQLEWEKWL